MPVAIAVTGAIGAIVALLIRGVPDPAVWRTGLVFGVLSLVVLTIVQVIAFNVAMTAPDPGGPIAIDIVGTLVGVALAALVARVVGRFLGFGKL